MNTGPRFLSTLHVRRASDNQPGAWELVAPLIYISNVLPRPVVVPPGFRTDFASVPRLPLVYWLFGHAADEAAVIHDFLYSNFTKRVTREQADEVFAEASKVLGIARWRRGPMWLGIRLFGGGHWGAGSPLATVEETAQVIDDDRD